MAVWLRRHHQRTRSLIIESEPASKGRGGERAATALQRQVMDEMERWRWYPMTGPVALDLHLRAARKNPPTIYRAAKHALDALGPAVPCNSRPRRRHVLYRDDRQIKFLYVDLDQAWVRGDPERTGSMFIMTRRARDVIADLHAAELVSGEGDDDEKSPFHMLPLPDEPVEPDWPPERSAHLSPVEQFLADYGRYRYLTDLQESILARTDAILASGVSSYLGSLTEASASPRLAPILEKSRTQTRELLLSNPLVPPLPGLPQRKGEAAEFEEQIRVRLEEFRSRWPTLQSLAVPVVMTFIVVPPQQGKDLDNIALTALPIAHDVLRPHIDPYLLSPLFRHGDPEPWREEALRRLRSVNACSVRAYQVVELPRTSNDPPEGVLRFALGLHSTAGSWWNHAADYLNEKIEEAYYDNELGDDLWDEVFAHW